MTPLAIRSIVSLAATLVLAVAVGCGTPAPPPAPPTPGAGPSANTPAPSRAAAANAAIPVHFVDVTAEAGIRFRHENGAAGQKYLPETMGAGAAFLDYDGDGQLDIYFVNSMAWPGGKNPAPALGALYRNLGGGRFDNQTAKAGLAVPMYGMGVTAGDYDNDGDTDLYLTCLGPHHLFRNDGGKFADVTLASGISDDGFGSSATWVDYDRDGDLDLLVGHYVHWSKESDIFCTLDGKRKSYCTPESYEGATPLLWRNDGKGTFTDVTHEAGLYKPTAKTLGVLSVDIDGDAWPDFVIANDTQPNFIFRNLTNGKFVEEGVASGIAFNENGVARGAMGLDAGDYDGSGRASLLIGNFSNEVKSLYHNEGNGLFVDQAPTANIAQASLLSLTFGCFFFDYDRDGFLDMFLANGHVEEEIEKVQTQVKHAQPPHLFRNVGAGRFAEVTQEVSEALAAPKVARGAAYGDYDGDGDLDLVVTTNGGPAYLYRNDGGNANHWLSVRTVGTKSNRDGLGSVVALTVGKDVHTTEVRAGMSYCSQSEPRASFGLGRTDAVTALEIRWPSGQVDRYDQVPVDRHVVATEGAGLKVAELAAH